MVYSTAAARRRRSSPRRAAPAPGGACSSPRASAASSARAAPSIGRSRECDIVLDDSNVSRRHAEIRPAGGGWTIADLGLDERRAGQRPRASTAPHAAAPRRPRSSSAPSDAALRGRVELDRRCSSRSPSRLQVRLPRRALPVPAVGRAQRAEGPAPRRRRARGRRSPPPTRPAMHRPRTRRRADAGGRAAPGRRARAGPRAGHGVRDRRGRGARPRGPGRDPARGPVRVLAPRRLMRQGGIVVLEDLGSTNGTYLNEELARPARSRCTPATACASATASSPTSTPLMLRVAEHFERTDTGRQRRANEDAYFARSPLFAVADGMGGAQAGEVASQHRGRGASSSGLPDGGGSVEERLAALRRARPTRASTSSSQRRRRARRDGHDADRGLRRRGRRCRSPTSATRAATACATASSSA